jgi:hypothetical protein
MRFYDRRYEFLQILTLAGIVVALIMVISIPSFITNTYMDITVTKTEISSDGDYMVFGTNSTDKVQSFTLNDSFWHWKWNTADTYALIEEGKTYNFYCSGIRVPILSMFPNILELELVE